MKRAIITLALLLGTFLCAPAQIQRNFFGFTLGTATKQEVSRHFKAKGNTITEETSISLIVSNVRFGGVDWDGVQFHFLKNKLSGVLFLNSALHHSNTDLERCSNKLRPTLMEKYSNYYYIPVTKDGYQPTMFKDGQTTLCLSLTDRVDDTMILSLIYLDEQLINEQIAAEDDEL